MAPASTTDYSANGNGNGVSAAPAATPLKVVIVGAGIGGLTAALALRQQGHDVTLLESSKFSTEIGAAINVPPYCGAVLKRLGLDLDKEKSVGAIECTGCNIWGASGQKFHFLDYHAERGRWQQLRRLVHRAHLHTALREKALSPDGPGKPCTLRTSSKVVSVDPEQGEAVLESGEKVSGDLIIGADGVHSQCRKALVRGQGYVPFDSGISAFRFLIPMQELRDDPLTKDVIGEPGNLLVVMGTGCRRLVCYPCYNNTIMNCIYLHPSAESRAYAEGPGLKEEMTVKQQMLQIASELAPPFRAILEKAPDDMPKAWVLLDMPTLPTWVNGKMALLGDAAHPFLPHRGEGAAQAIDDAVSLGIFLPLGTSVEDIPERLALYERSRKERAERIQEASRLNSLPVAEQRKKGFNPREFDDYSFSHDQWHKSTRALREAQWAKLPYRWRQPLGFGPAPGPCQPRHQLHGRKEGSRVSQPYRVVHSIRFATSKTFLQNLFPTASFSFAAPDTVVQASWVCSSFRDLPWLGGAGYDRVALHLHGAKYTRANGESVLGAFVPVQFENLADAVVTGRDERGAPTFGCDIEGSDTPDSKTITLSWRGAVFGQLRWAGLSERATTVPAPKTDREQGLLMYRYVPAIGKPGKADVEYAVFDPYDASLGPGKEADSGHANGTLKPSGATDPDSLYASQASFQFTAGEWQSLPTMHLVAKTLQDIPIYDILEAKVETVEGGDDFTHAHRID